MLSTTLWPVLEHFWLSKNDATEHSERKKKKKVDRTEWEDSIKVWIGMDFASFTGAADDRTR